MGLVWEGEGHRPTQTLQAAAQRWISPVSSADKVRESRHKPKTGLGQHELPWLPCFRISTAAGCTCYCVSNQQDFFPESLSIFGTIYVHSIQGTACLFHTVTSLCGKILPSPVKAATLALGSPSSCAREYRSCPPSCPHCPRLHMALIYPSLPFLHSHSTELLMMGKLPWQPPCPFLKYILNKENLFKSFLGWREGDSAACEMQEMHNQRCTSRT